MSRLLVEFVANRDNCGLATLFSAEGRVVWGPFPVAGRSSDKLAQAHRNPGRNPLFCFGDTPTGRYAVSGVRKSGPSTQFPVEQFGRQGVVVLEPLSGDAALAEANGRFSFLICGGALAAGGFIRSTAGSLRLQDKHLHKLLTAMGRSPIEECEIIERRTLASVPGVRDDSSCVHDDPFVFSVGNQRMRTAGSLRERHLGAAAGAMLFGVTVTFVSFQDIPKAQAATSSETRAALVRRDVTAPQPSSRSFGFPARDAAPSRNYVRMAYNDVNAEVDESIGAAKGPETATYLEQMQEIGNKIVEEGPKEVTNDALTRLRDDLRNIPTEDVPPTFDSFKKYVQNTDVELQIKIRASDYEGKAGFIQGVQDGVKLYDSAKHGWNIGTGINDYIDGKIDGVQLAQKIGPEPAKVLLSAFDIPFGDQIVDATVATGNTVVGGMIDAGFWLSDKIHGYK